MPITAQELQWQTESLIKQVMLSVPKNIGAIVVFVDNESGLLAMRAMRLDRTRARETLEAVLKGYGVQNATEGVDLVRP